MSTLTLIYAYIALMAYTYMLSVDMAGRDDYGLHVIPGILGAVFMPLALPTIMIIHMAVWAARKTVAYRQQARPS